MLEFTHMLRFSVDLVSSLPSLRFTDLYKLALGPILYMFHSMKFHPSLLNSRNTSYMSIAIVSECDLG